MVLITIIIPLYNEQNNVKQCIQTLKKQTNQNFDVVFIDDGSTDNTLECLSKELYNEVKFQFKILKQTNEGAASARKSGLNSSSTEYIFFYDCDDIISDNMIESIYESIDNYVHPDIIIPNMSLQKKDGKWQELQFFSNAKVLNPLDCIKYSLNGWRVSGIFAIKKSILIKSYKDYYKYNSKNKNYINNDEVITRLNFLNSQHIVRSDAIYYYCFNESSTTKRFNENIYLQLKNTMIMDAIFAKHPYLNKSIKIELLSHIWAKYRWLHDHTYEINNVENWHVALKESVNYINYFDLLPHLSLKQKIKLSILKLKYAF